MGMHIHKMGTNRIVTKQFTALATGAFALRHGFNFGGSILIAHFLYSDQAFCAFFLLRRFFHQTNPNTVAIE